MNAQKFTKKALEAINSAQSIAIENQNMQIMPEHLLYALVDQEGGLIPQLFKKMGVVPTTSSPCSTGRSAHPRGERQRQRAGQNLYLPRD